jgi:hypothetical protein
MTTMALMAPWHMLVKHLTLFSSKLWSPLSPVKKKNEKKKKNNSGVSFFSIS